MSLHPSEQWFTVYEYVDWTFKTKKGQPVAVPPSWGPKEDVQHVHHPDSYHPDVRVRIAHQREILRSGVKKTACGAEVDPRCVFVEETGAEKCPKCVEATDIAKMIHADAVKGHGPP